jgi:hypothetical protein
MRRLSAGVLRIIAVNSIVFTPGGVSFTAKPVSAFILKRKMGAQVVVH